MNCILVFITLLLSAAAAFATDVSGNVEGNWTVADSPYNVIGHVTVPSGQTLRIAPGVQVLFTGHYKFIVYGGLKAIGTAQDSIIFTRAFPTEASKWWSIRFRGTIEPCSLAYCRIEYGRATASSDPYDDIGGGVFGIQSSPVISHCLIANNYAARAGGGLCFDGGSPVIKFCRISSNHSATASSNSGAGGIAFWLSSPVVSYCLLDHNSVSGLGDASAITHGPPPYEATITNCTFTQNTTTAGYGLFRCYQGATIATTNCIAWDNQGTSVCGNVRYSDIQGGYPGTGNINADPQFVDPAHGDLHLQATSPCIDAGDPASPLDPDGTIADMGAFGRDDIWSTIRFVGGFNGMGCPCAYPFTLREGSQVWLRRDLTHDGVSTDDPIVDSFLISAGAGLPPWDGFWTPRPDSLLTPDSFYVELITDVCCWLSGNLQFTGGSVVIVGATGWTCSEGGDPGSGCGAPTPTPVCGSVSGVWDLPGSPYVVTCDLTVPAGQTLEIRPGVRVLFSGHYRFNVHGTLLAIGTEQDSITFTRQFPTEESQWWGIRFYEDANDSSRLEYCVIEHSSKGEGNDSDTNGGGLLCENASPTFAHCTVRYNQASRGGGIMGWAWSTPTIDHCLFAHNAVPWTFGGGIWIGLLGGVVSNTTIVGNYPDGVYSEVGVELRNTIIAQNSGPAVTGSSAVTASYSDFFGNSEGTGNGPSGQLVTVNHNGDSCDANFNIFLDPLFVDTLMGDFWLRGTSPCIDAGNPSSPPDPDGTIADLGALPYTHAGLIISLRGPAEILLPPVDSLVVKRGALNGTQLFWAPVTHTVSGQPFTPPYYLIYGSTTPEGPFQPFGVSLTASYHHPLIVSAQAKYFYQVTAATE